MVVMDYGACYHDYHADMTRTACLSKPGDQERHVYDVVRRAHEKCARAARPGILGKDLHNLAARIIEEAGYGGCFNHGLGHGVGIEIHELPHVGRLGEKGIPVGAVFTIEPGIYLKRRFGVRLEDTGVMGEHGFEPFAISTHALVCVS
jgi:Xaa-Pro aminopeptidase